MIKVSREEADKIHKAFPEIDISRTMRNHSKAKRGKRFAPPYDNVLAMLSNMRGVRITRDTE